MKKILVAVIILCITGIYLAFIKINSIIPVYLSVSGKPSIIVDPGHGGFDGGAVGVSDIVEKNINLAISLYLCDILKANGYNVIMTRSEDTALHDTSIKGVQNQKTSDLTNRLQFTKDHPNAIFLSIHQNKFSQQNCSGAQIFYGPINKQSEFLAQIIQSNFREGLQPENEREIKKAGDNLFILTNSKIPAVLIECGFISNYDEAEKLVTENYQKKVAFIIFCSIIEYMGM